MSQKARVFSGIDRIAQYSRLLKGRRIGLMTNPTGIDHQLKSTIDILHKGFGLSALFACEHGVRGDRQAGEQFDTCTDPDTGIPVYSVYGKNRRMTPEMVDAFDILVFDIQDVGARFYTYLYSLAYAMEACARAGKPVLVLDRINPLGGVRHGGTILDLRFRSFVGDYRLPTRTGMTIGEFARYVKAYLKLDLDLSVAPLKGWRRRMYLDDTDLPWVAPSPNCPTLQAALVYVGTCIFEGTNLSEGRGTAQPFELIGAPFIRAGELERHMAGEPLPGLHFRAASFQPTFSKHQGALCHGVQLHITDRERADPILGALRLLDAVRQLYPDKIEFISWDGGQTYTLDKLLGTDLYRIGQMGGRQLLDHFAPQVQAFREALTPYLLYQS